MQLLFLDIFTEFLFRTFLCFIFLIVCLLADLLEGVEVNPERPSKKQSEHHMPSFGKYKQVALRFSFLLPFVDDLVSFQSIYCPFNFVYPSLKERGL